MILTRQILNKELVYDGKSYDELCDMIDFWKVLMWEKYGLRPGDSVGTFTSRTDPLYLSFVFACLELGVALSVVDQVIAQKSVYRQSLYKNLKLAMFDVVQFEIWPETVEHARTCFKHVDDMNIFFSYVVQDSSLWDKIKNTIFAKKTTVAINTTSSGTTGVPKVSTHSHEWLYSSSIRAIARLALVEEDNIMHCRQLSHGCVLDLFLLPTLMACKYHYNFNYNEDSLLELSDQLRDKKINKVMIFSSVDGIIKSLHKMNHSFDLLVLTRLQKEWIPICKEKNINRILGVYGSSDIGNLILGPEINQGTQEETFDVTNYGPLLDDYFDLQIMPESVLITNNEFKKTVELNDKFELKDGNYYFYGRTKDYKINDIFIRPEDINQLVSLFIKQDYVTVIDEEYQKIFIAVYAPIEPDVMEKINQQLNKSYETKIQVSILDQVPFDQFNASFKVSMPLLRAHFRQLLD
jgi:acyl-CoA synthetase (AMP-forming)/AMP-acid ligase II